MIQHQMTESEGAKLQKVVSDAAVGLAKLAGAEFAQTAGVTADEAVFANLAAVETYRTMFALWLATVEAMGLDVVALYDRATEFDPLAQRFVLEQLRAIRANLPGTRATIAQTCAETPRPTSHLRLVDDPSLTTAASADAEDLGDG